MYFLFNFSEVEKDRNVKSKDLNLMHSSTAAYLFKPLEGIELLWVAVGENIHLELKIAVWTNKKICKYFENWKALLCHDNHKSVHPKNHIPRNSMIFLMVLKARHQRKTGWVQIPSPLLISSTTLKNDSTPVTHSFSICKIEITILTYWTVPSLSN